MCTSMWSMFYIQHQQYRCKATAQFPSLQTQEERSLGPGAPCRAGAHLHTGRAHKAVVLGRQWTTIGTNTCWAGVLCSIRNLNTVNVTAYSQCEYGLFFTYFTLPAIRERYFYASPWSVILSTAKTWFCRAGCYGFSRAVGDHTSV